MIRIVKFPHKITKIKAIGSLVAPYARPMAVGL